MLSLQLIAVAVYAAQLNTVAVYAAVGADNQFMSLCYAAVDTDHRRGATVRSGARRSGQRYDPLRRQPAVGVHSCLLPGMSISGHCPSLNY